MRELSKYAILYMPEDGTAPTGVVQIIHDMCEYQGRYRALAQFLSNHGFAVITSDLRGHGNHLPRMSELGYFGDNAISRIIGDIHENTQYIRTQFPNVPYMMIGHGVGALIATIYFKRYDNFLNGLFLTGLPSDRKIRIPGKILISLYIALRGEFFRSKFIDAIMVSPYYRPFIKEGSASVWLSSDPEAVKSYDSDPKCGFIYTLNGFRTLMEIMDGVFTSGSWIRKNLACPIRILCGSDDPCTLNQASFQKSIHIYSDQGYRDVAYINYPGFRHDIFQEKEKETVFENVLLELERICSGEVFVAEDAKAEPRPLHIVLDEQEDFIDPEVEKPFQNPEPKINLEEFINAHNAAHPDDASAAKAGKVEMIDYNNIEAFIDTGAKTFGKPEFSEYQTTEDATSVSAAKQVTKGNSSVSQQTSGNGSSISVQKRTAGDSTPASLHNHNPAEATSSAVSNVHAVSEAAASVFNDKKITSGTSAKSTDQTIEDLSETRVFSPADFRFVDLEDEAARQAREDAKRAKEEAKEAKKRAAKRKAAAARRKNPRKRQPPQNRPPRNAMLEDQQAQNWPPQNRPSQDASSISILDELSPDDFLQEFFASEESTSTSRGESPKTR